MDGGTFPSAEEIAFLNKAPHYLGNGVPKGWDGVIRLRRKVGGVTVYPGVFEFALRPMLQGWPFLTFGSVMDVRTGKRYSVQYEAE